MLRDVTRNLRGEPSAGCQRLKAQQRPQERGLPTPVRPEDRHRTSDRDVERDVLEQDARSKGDGCVFEADHARFTSLKWRRSKIPNTGAPIRAVRTPSGISAAVSVRANVSIKVR